MADEAGASEAAYVDAIFDIQLKVGLSGTEECWEQGNVIAESRDDVPSCVASNHAA
jgi:hypothetical protein